MAGVAPELLAQYNAEHEQKLNELVNLVDSPEWVLHEDKPEISIFYRNDPNSSYCQAKGVVKIPVTLETVFNKLKTIQKIDPSMPAEKRDGIHERYSFNEIEGDEHLSCFLYVGLESPKFMVAPREFLMYRRHYFVEGKHIFLHMSIENDSIKQPVNGFVRAKMLLQGYVAEVDSEDPSTTKLSFIAHADPCGCVPAIVYNQTVTNQCYIAKKIRDQILAEK